MVKPRPRELYVEGGGDHNPALASEFRKAFSQLLERAGVEHRPRIIVCGGRRRAYDQFAQALKDDASDVWLLVDAESLVASGPPFDPWAHVLARQGDQWVQPPCATDEHLHFMAVCMETWILSDHDALKKVFGPKLDATKLPAAAKPLESVDKQQVYNALQAATKPTPAGEYGKGKHAVKVLAEVRPQALRKLSWAARFLDAMRTIP